MATNAQPITVIANLLDLTDRRVQQLSREGVIPKAERRRYDLVSAVRGYVAYLREPARPPTHGGQRVRRGRYRCATSRKTACRLSS